MAVTISKATIEKLMAEDCVPMKEARYYFPGKTPDLSTLHRWRTRGARGVRLESLCVGGVWMTSRDAVVRFIQKRSAV